MLSPGSAPRKVLGTSRRRALSAGPAADDSHLHRMVLLAMDVGYDAEADFDFGLDVILDGLGRVLSTSEAGR